MKPLIRFAIVWSCVCISACQTLQPAAPSRDRQVMQAPQKVALLLPMQGPHAKSARAVRDGLLAAYYQNVSPRQEIQFKIHDTGRGDNKLMLKQAYDQALTEQADCIVGPLTKFEVETLAHYAPIRMPVLALNSVPSDSRSAIYQFSLLPETEAIEAARRAYSQGQTSALIIAPASEWGSRMAEAFSLEFKTLGGRVLEQHLISAQAPLDVQIRELLQMPELVKPKNKDKTQEAEVLTQEVLSAKPLDEEPQPRADVDCIFLAASPELARQVRPQLIYYNAGKLPIYASSHIYSGQSMAQIDRDLDGIEFCDMAWLLDNSPTVQASREQFAQQWGESFEHAPRVFAMGLDIYQLMVQAYPFENLSRKTVEGYTGRLSLGPNRHIERALRWARFVEGVPQILSDLNPQPISHPALEDI